MRRTPLRARPQRDPVSTGLRLTILVRDGGCVAPEIDLDVDASECRGRLTLDHVKSEPMMGRRAPSDERHLVSLCEWHHLWSGWATAHRPLLREYLARVNS